MPDPELFPGAAVPEKDRAAILIYRAYPKHVGRRSALRAIRVALNNRGVSFALLLKRTQKFAASVEHKRKTAAWKFVPYPATWFNRDGWTDEIEAVVATVQPGHDPKVQAEWDGRARKHAQDAYRWWAALSENERATRRREHRPYGLPDEAIAIAEFRE
jgi:hypothetical protein